MSRSCRLCTPPLVLATLNAVSTPSFIFWPSSLAAPLNGAEIPNRISFSVTPRTATSLAFSSGTASRDCLTDAATDCCCPDTAAIVVAAAPALLSTAMALDGADACGASEAASRCAPEPCQSGLVAAATIMITTAKHEAMIAKPLNKVSSEYPRRCACGWCTGSGSYRRRRVSFSKPPPEEGALEPPLHSACIFECEGDMGGELTRSDEAAGTRGCSCNLLAAGICGCLEVSSSLTAALMIQPHFGMCRLLKLSALIWEQSPSSHSCPCRGCWPGCGPSRCRQSVSHQHIDGKGYGCDAFVRALQLPAHGSQ